MAYINLNHEIYNQLYNLFDTIGSLPLQNEATSEVYVGDFGLHNSRLHKCHHIIIYLILLFDTTICITSGHLK